MVSGHSGPAVTHGTGHPPTHFPRQLPTTSRSPAATEIARYRIMSVAAQTEGSPDRAGTTSLVLSSSSPDRATCPEARRAWLLRTRHGAYTRSTLHTQLGLPRPHALLAGREPRGPASPAGHAADARGLQAVLLEVQRLAGNRAVASLVQPRPSEEKHRALVSALKDITGLLGEAGSLEDAEPMLADVASAHGLRGLTVVDSGDAWEVTAEINPKQKKTVPKKSPTKKRPTAKPPTKKPRTTKVAAPRARRQNRVSKPRVVRESKLKRGTLSMKFDPTIEYSDSEDESDYNKKHGRRMTGGIVNYTKWGRGQQGKPKVDNTLDTSGLSAAVGCLEPDAKAIHDLIGAPTDRSFGATTITCAIVSRKDGAGYRKFVFSNLASVMPPQLRSEAERRGYHVVAAPQAHAEGEMIQYMGSRMKVYHQHEMGVDKEHCAECQWAMDIYFGVYNTQTGKSTKVFNNWYNPPSLQEALGQTDAGTQFRHPTGERI